MFAVIFIPDFSLQAVLRHEPDLISRPAGLMDPELTKLGIIQLTGSAWSAGVCEGMTASQAMGRCAELVIKSRAPRQEQAATEVLMETAYAFSPFIESTGPGICTIELRGLRAQENETAAREWAEEIRKVLGRFYLEGRIGFAMTPELALLAARMAEAEKLQTFIVSDIAEFAAGLPIQMLGLTEEMLEILNRWGITTAGALLALGKGQVVARLGPGAIEVFERFSPNSIRPLKLASLPETFAEQMEFENPIETLEPLLFVLRRFTEQLSRRIELLYLVVAELHLKLGLASGAAYESVFKVPSPTGNAEILFRMLHTHLENVRTDAPISLLWLVAKPGRPEAHQFGLFETTLRNPNQFAETLARLEALCGPNRVGTPCLEPTLRPDSFRMKRAEFCESGEKKKTSRASGAKSVRARGGRRPIRNDGLSSELNEAQKAGRVMGSRPSVASAPPNAGCGLNVYSSGDSHSCSAGFQPAVSPISNRPSLEIEPRLRSNSHSLQAGSPAIQQVGNLRYFGSDFDGLRTRLRGALRTARSTFERGLELQAGPRAGGGSQHVRDLGLRLRRFRPVMPARVEFREQSPALIRSAVCNGAIVDQRGPFLSSGNWWDDSRWRRQEWDVQMTDGRMYRIFRTAEECMVEGVYD